MAITEKNTMQSRKPVWFITGCSTGFGRQIARISLNQLPQRWHDAIWLVLFQVFVLSSWNRQTSATR